MSSNLERSILNRVLLIMSFGGVLIFGLSTMRIVTEGFQPKFGLMWLVAASIISLRLFRNKLQAKAIGFLLFALFTIMGLVALLNDGLASIGSIFLFLGLSTSAVVVGTKTFFLLIGLQFTAFSAITALTVMDVLAPVPDDTVEYLTSGKTWLFHGIVISIGAAISFYGSNLLGQWYRNSLTETKDTFYNAISILSLARDTETGEHIARVSKYSEILYDALTQNQKEQLHFTRDELKKSVRLHDVGKISISDALLKKPGKLSEDEFEEMKLHTTVGADIIGSILNHHQREDRVLSLGQSVALNHHENWDGSGYPNGLESTKIPIEARIMAIADVYDALRSKRPYKTAYSHAETIRIMTSMSGSKFDPDLFETFLSVADQFDRAYATSRVSKEDDING